MSTPRSLAASGEHAAKMATAPADRALTAINLRVFRFNILSLLAGYTGSCGGRALRSMARMSCSETALCPLTATRGVGLKAWP